MTEKEKVDVLNELINKYAESPNPHEHDMVLNVLKAIKNDIISKEEPVSEDLEEAAMDAAMTDMCDRQIMECSSDERLRYSRIFRRGFKAGAKHIMRMLMKSAVNGAAWEDFKDDGNKWLVINATGTKLRKGDSFKMIIIKEEWR